MAFVCLSKRSINIKQASVLLLISLSGSHVLQGLSPLTQRCVTGGFWRLWMCRYLLEYIHLTKLKIKGLMEACLSQSILPRSTNWLEGSLLCRELTDLCVNRRLQFTDRQMCSVTCWVWKCASLPFPSSQSSQICPRAASQSPSVYLINTSSVCVCFVFLLLEASLDKPHK